MVRGVRDVLVLVYPSQAGKRAQGLQVARPRIQVLSRLGVQRRIEAPEAAQIGSLAADVGHIQHYTPTKLVLKAGVPLLHVRRRKMAVQAVVAGKPGAGRGRESFTRGE